MYRKKTILLLSLSILAIFFSLFYFEKRILAQTSQRKILGAVIQGRVLSPYGPVENARVRVVGEEKYTLTDRQGRYVLQTQHPPVLKLRVTAGKEGWFNNAQITSNSSQDTDIFMYPIYLNDQPDYSFISPVTCAGCHIKLSRYWDQSKMAHTTSNPKVLDMYNGTDALRREGVGPGYRLDNPNSNGNCAECHAPSAVASGRWSQDLNAVLQSSRAEWDGISCDFCHKIRKVTQNKDKPSGVSAVLERQSSSSGPSILVFGPYDDVVVSPMAASYNQVYEQGQYCSVCHSHFKKLDGGKTWSYNKVYSTSEWKGFGLENNTVVPVQTTYQEWKMWQDQLSFDDPNKGKKCQDCHMSWRKEMLPYDNYVVDKGARHMWGTHRSPKNIHPHHFDGGTQTQLKTALAMELEGETSGNRLTVNVYITNTNGGHWVPTGETMRSVMLLLQARDASGKPLKMIKGSRLPEWTGVGKAGAGNYAGLPGAVFARVLGDDQGNLHVPFWRATHIAVDNRIRPKGTVTLQFQFALENPEDEPSAEAKIIYRPVIRPLAEQKRWLVEDILITSSVW
ncbi:MAG: carboxypeptidase regulatory-like domain-containing protein [Deltaproteobacteria bacterium]|nr:MAG: carboxypeptidase regulatory-like domain-containing protein [Deltaproteobacteria bacterium]